MARPCNKPDLDPATESALRQMTRARNVTAAFLRRVIAIRLIASGHGLVGVARDLAMDRTTVFRLIRRFHDLGLSGLHDSPRRLNQKPANVELAGCKPLIPVTESSLATTLRQLAERHSKWTDD
jgi:hypothetical protein